MYKEVCISICDLIIIGTVIMATVSLLCLLLWRNNKRLLLLRMQVETLETRHHKELLEVSIRSQEEEKSRIGQNLHDDLGNALATLRLTVDMPLYEYFDSTSFEVFRTTCKHLVDKIIKDVRDISHSLFPTSLKIHGLLASVEDIAETVNHTGKLEISVVNEAGDAVNQLQHNTALSLYRVIEELITNTIKHAQARKVSIRFSAQNGFLSINYQDDGKGIEPPESRGMGMSNIENRLQLLDAYYKISSTAGQGFSMQISFSII